VVEDDPNTHPRETLADQSLGDWGAVHLLNGDIDRRGRAVNRSDDRIL
jgi:hypothetical protein